MSATIHAYAHDKQGSAQLGVFIAAIVAAAGWGKFVEVFHVPSPWWFDGLGPMTFVGILTAVFNKWGWRWLYRLHGVADLSGVYDLKLKSSNDEQASIEGTLTVAQEWQRILVTVKTSTSTSSSVGAWLTDDPTQGAVLTYTYRNDPSPDAKDDLQAHAGTATVTFARDGTASGRYYNDRGRQTFGSMTLTKRVSETKSSASNKPSAAGVPSAPTTVSTATKPPDARAS
ncbi:MAG: hypothetical protein JNK05_31825 [Myxococcales bacterium]|nr:hypothetical protein [Myxococcales bacterium]